MLKIRLRREGSRNHPFFRVAVSDSRRTPNGRVLEILGHYDPKTNPAQVRIDLEKYDAWLAKGAHASDSVRSLVRQLRRGEQGEAS
ncbi:MAG: 30S ribosomal protein S16 [Acidobacteriota bacterium]|nr:MAG: 30S ribosomal protein S16 [Acidobacteriota bacterium]